MPEPTSEHRQEQAASKTPVSALAGQAHTAPSDVELALRERVKELDCLYTISRLQEKHFPAIDQFLQAVADRMPASFRLPDKASARIRCGKRTFVSTPFAESQHRIVAPIRVDQKQVGELEVFYRQIETSNADDVFLPEEYPLIEAVADRIAVVLKQMRAERALREAHQSLQVERDTLAQTNIALRTVMSRLEEEKREIRASLATNVRKIVMPIVLELELQVTGRHRAYVTLLRQNLEQIADPFMGDIARRHAELTPVELAISMMIRNGMSSKEIARLRCISPATVHRHRENIRRKLGLQKSKINLTTYLQSDRNDGFTNTPDPSANHPDQDNENFLDDLW